MGWFNGASTLKGSLVLKQGGVIGVNSSQTLNLSANGGALTVVFQPPVGQQWRCLNLVLNAFNYPSGATSNQYLSIMVGGYEITTVIPFTSAGVITAGQWSGVAGNQTWPTPDAFYDFLSHVVATNKNPVKFVFTNGTNLANTTKLTMYTSWEVEALDDIT